MSFFFSGHYHNTRVKLASLPTGKIPFIQSYFNFFFEKSDQWTEFIPFHYLLHATTYENPEQYKNHDTVHTLGGTCSSARRCTSLGTLCTQGDDDSRPAGWLAV